MLQYLSKYSDPIGILGVMLVLYGYFMLQIERIDLKGWPYSFLNAIGSIFILVSLEFHWNLASGIIEFAWLVISVYGLVKALNTD